MIIMIFTNSLMSLMLCTNDALGGVDHPLQRLPLLSPAPNIPVCDVSCHDAFYCSSVKVDHNLANLDDHDSF